MTATLNKDLFAGNISRRIEEVIKVDQDDEQIVREELAEYVVTAALRKHFTGVFDAYAETPNKPHEGIGVWVSGFFGSGKSSFAKYLGLALANRSLLGEGSGAILGRRIGDNKSQTLLASIAEHIPTEAVIFDVSADRGIRSGNQSITEITYRVFLRQLGYASDLDLAELEIALESEGQLDEFKAKYGELYDGKEWDDGKGLIAFAVSQASRVMHELDPATFTTADSWQQAQGARADISPKLLAERCQELMDRRRPGKSLVFVVDEIGQFVARDVGKMLDLQAVVQQLGRVGRGKMWYVVTSQEKLSELVAALDDKKVELARLKDRFPLQVDLEPSDISEVTSRRVLSKSADGERQLLDLYQTSVGRLKDNTRLTADVRLPELTPERFADLYPLLPYQVDLIISLVSGLRTQGGASKHVGGANRTIIKLAQQLLINPEVNLAEKQVGSLATIEEIYDLVAGNIASEMRGKIDDIGRKVDPPLAQPVAKGICVLQFVRSIHATAENLAAALCPAVDADSRLPEVREALEALTKARSVRHGDEGYRIPSPAEDGWEDARASLAPKQSDLNRLYSDAVAGLWQPTPVHKLSDVRAFKAALHVNDRLVTEGDIVFQLTLASAGDPDGAVQDARTRSREEGSAVFWVAGLTGAVEHEATELFRSKEMVSRKERDAQTKDESGLVSEEKLRQRRHQEELKRRLRESLLGGDIFFRGNDRSPAEGAADVGKVASSVLAQVLPDVYHKFSQAAARVTNKDIEAVLASENLLGLPGVFAQLGLAHDEAGRPALKVASGPLAEILARIADRASYGEAVSGRSVAEEFGKEPFGWDLDVVRLLVACLLRARKIDVTSKGRTITSSKSVEAQQVFTNNNFFRGATYRPAAEEDPAAVLQAYRHLKEVFGRDVAEIDRAAVAEAIRLEVVGHEETLRDVQMVLVRYGLPGSIRFEEALGQMSSIHNSDDQHVIRVFNASYNDIGQAARRGAEIEGALTEPALHDLGRAKDASTRFTPALSTEPDLNEAIRQEAEKLADILGKESFYRELPAIYACTRALEQEYAARHKATVEARVAAYGAALERLRSLPSWGQLSVPQQELVSEGLAERSSAKGTDSMSLAMLREQAASCEVRLREAQGKAVGLLRGGRLVAVPAATFFDGGIETEEQLDAALDGLRHRILELIAQGKTALIQ